MFQQGGQWHFTRGLFLQTPSPIIIGHNINMLEISVLPSSRKPAWTTWDYCIDLRRDACPPGYPWNSFNKDILKKGQGLGGNRGAVGSHKSQRWIIFVQEMIKTVEIFVSYKKTHVAHLLICRGRNPKCHPSKTQTHLLLDCSMYIWVRFFLHTRWRQNLKHQNRCDVFEKRGYHRAEGRPVFIMQGWHRPWFLATCLQISCAACRIRQCVFGIKKHKHVYVCLYMSQELVIYSSGAT